ncbi:hypothetical protein Avbf_03410 [Armadillidium vulgare]|nr:hypothetical protein Avbf_03410 [Armadillidium vulgare]
MTSDLWFDLRETSKFNYDYLDNQILQNGQIGNFLDLRFLFKAVTILNSRTYILTSEETFPNLHYDHILEQSKYYKMVKSAIFLDLRFLFKAVTILYSRSFQKRMIIFPFFTPYVLTSEETFPNLHYDHILEQSKYYKMVKLNNQSTTKWSNRQIFLDRRFLFKAVTILNSRLFQKRMTTIPFFRTHILTSGETFPNLHYDHILEQIKYYKMVKSANLFKPEISFNSSYNFKFKAISKPNDNFPIFQDLCFDLRGNVPKFTL